MLRERRRLREVEDGAVEHGGRHPLHLDQVGSAAALLLACVF